MFKLLSKSVVKENSRYVLCCSQQAKVLNLCLMFFKVIGQFSFDCQFPNGVRHRLSLRWQIWTATVFLFNIVAAFLKLFWDRFTTNEFAHIYQLLYVYSFCLVAIVSYLILRTTMPLLKSLAHIMKNFPRNVSYKRCRSYYTELVVVSSTCLQLYFVIINIYNLFKEPVTAWATSNHIGNALFNLFWMPVSASHTFFSYSVMAFLSDALRVALRLIDQECRRQGGVVGRTWSESKRSTYLEESHAPCQQISYINPTLHRRKFDTDGACNTDSANATNAKSNTQNQCEGSAAGENEISTRQLNDILKNCEKFVETAIDTGLLYVEITSPLQILLTGHCLLHLILSLFLFVDGLLQGVANYVFLFIAGLTFVLFFSVNNSVEIFKRQHSQCRQQFRMMCLGYSALHSSHQAQRLQAVFDRDVQFTLKGFTNFGRAYFSSVLGFVLTYLIILLQFRLTGNDGNACKQ